MISIGQMKERITFLSPTEERSLSGEATLDWSDHATVWAHVAGLSTRDLMQAQQANVIATHKIQCRKRDDVTQANRIRWEGRTMEIASVVKRGEHLEILAHEVQ